jgi:hypothetical protein
MWLTYFRNEDIIEQQPKFIKSTIFEESQSQCLRLYNKIN